MTSLKTLIPRGTIVTMHLGQRALGGMMLAAACLGTTNAMASGTGSDANFLLGSSIATKKAFHAYLQLPASDGIKTVKFHIETSTGISETRLEEPRKVNVYTLSGAEVRHQVAVEKAAQGLPKGIYIINKKKIIVK